MKNLHAFLMLEVLLFRPNEDVQAIKIRLAREFWFAS
jgi:hypothetical protein